MRWAFAVFLLSAITCAEAPVEHIVLVTLDTHRADVIGAYGSPAGHTPNFDRIAAHSAIFEHAVTPIGTTVPAHLSMFTGLYPRRHGVRFNGAPIPEGLASLAGALESSGFATAAFVSRRFVAPAAVGFGRVEHPVDVPSDRLGTDVVSRAIRWRRAQTTPTFSWIHLFDVHAPYVVRHYSSGVLRADGYAGPFSDGASVQEFYALNQRPPTDEDLAAVRALYEGEVRHVDALVGRLWDELGAQSGKRTLWVITSDHGQLLGEHEGFGHGYRLWEPVLRVPLLVRGPGIAARRIEQTVGLIDLAPTLLELAGLPVLPGIDGRSLAPLVRGGALPDAPYFSGSQTKPGPPPTNVARAGGPVIVYAGKLKGWLDADSFSVFDLAADPSESAPLAGSEVGSRDEMRDAALGQRDGLGKSRRGGIEPGLLEELRELGYVE